MWHSSPLLRYYLLATTTCRWTNVVAQHGKNILLNISWNRRVHAKSCAIGFEGFTSDAQSEKLTKNLSPKSIQGTTSEGFALLSCSFPARIDAVQNCFPSVRRSAARLLIGNENFAAPTVRHRSAQLHARPVNLSFVLLQIQFKFVISQSDWRLIVEELNENCNMTCFSVSTSLGPPIVKPRFKRTTFRCSSLSPSGKQWLGAVVAVNDDA